MTDRAWQKIFDTYNIHQHDFLQAPFYISADEVKQATTDFTATREREPRILCKHDTRESRPQIFIDHDLFLLPVRNGHYAILRGEGYVDIPPVTETIEVYKSDLDFKLDTALVGNSEMQHVDYAYAASLIRSVMDDTSLVLTIRGRKYTPAFSFRVGNVVLETASVQTEVDAGYEGRNQVVLFNTSRGNVTNLCIWQFFYLYRQYSYWLTKPIRLILFVIDNNIYSIHELIFADRFDLNSVRVKMSKSFQIKAQSD